MKKNEGFTVVELLVTVSIFALFVAISLRIGHSTVQRSSFNAAINQFVADFYSVRQLAAMENRYVAIVFDPSGTSYSIRVQKEVKTTLTANPATYLANKEVTPMAGDEFFESGNVADFAINSTGVVRAYPVVPSSDPVQLTLNFFKKDRASEEIEYQKRIWIYPTGGIKIER